MCEHYAPIKRAWKGWLPLPAASGETGTGPWTDLTHVLTEDLSRASAFPKPVIRQILSMPEGNANITEIHMVAHHGTHVDAPRHFMIDGPTFEQIPLERLYGPAVVWRIEKEPFGVITAQDFEAARPALKPGDMVLLDTGWAKYVNTEKYEDHPYLSIDAASWLVEHQVKLLGVDFSTPDLTAHKRPSGFTWPVHQILLSQGVLVAEHLTNLAPLANTRVEAMFLALPIAGSDGAPARVLARPL
jgi:kynurenine formamidase